jgi:hypothetical protein
MNIEELYSKHHPAILAAICSIAGSQEAEILSSDFWTSLIDGTLTPDDEARETLIALAMSRARKSTNKRQKEKFKVKTYTDNPPAIPEFGVITQSEHQAICNSSIEEDNSKALLTSSAMRTIFASLRTSDQEFLTAWENLKAKELIPRYGPSQAAIRQRAFKLKQRIRQELAVLTK